MKKLSKQDKRKRRHKRVRAKVFGTGAVPRLSVFRSNRHIWAQLIDDTAGKTLVSASDKEFTAKSKTKKSAKENLTKEAEKVGEAIAKKAAAKKIHLAVFDRGGYRYHGVVRALAEGARKGGLKF